MATAHSQFYNAIYVVVGVWLLVSQGRILNLLHAIVMLRDEMKRHGIKPAIRNIPYSASVSTMCFCFGALAQIVLYIMFAALPVNTMTPYEVLAIHMRNALFIGGAFASASHKRCIYSTAGPEQRDGDGEQGQLGKENGGGSNGTLFPPADPAARRQPTQHH